MVGFRYNTRHLPKQTQVIINQKDRVNETLPKSSKVTKEEQTGENDVPEISGVIVYLDDTVPEFMSGIIRTSGVETHYQNGDYKEHPELNANDEFHSTDELIKWGAEQLDVPADIIEVN